MTPAASLVFLVLPGGVRHFCRRPRLGAARGKRASVIFLRLSAGVTLVLSSASHGCLFQSALGRTADSSRLVAALIIEFRLEGGYFIQ